jgi:hypothetical protein
MLCETAPSSQAFVSSHTEAAAEDHPILAIRNLRQAQHQQDFSSSKKEKAKHREEQETEYSYQTPTES